MGWSIPVLCMWACVYIRAPLHSYHGALLQGCNAMALEHCSVLISVPVFSVYPWLLVCSSHRVSSRVIRVPRGASVPVCVRMWVKGGYEPLWTACQALWQLGSSSSVAAHCSLRQPYYGRRPAVIPPIHTVTHTCTHTRTKITQTLVSCGSVPGCCPTSPQQGPPALHRRGK